MNILINLEETARKLSDEAIGFDTENAVKKEIGIDWDYKDARITLEWCQFYDYHLKILKGQSDFPLISKERSLETAQFVKKYCKENNVGSAVVYKMIKFKSLKVK